MIAVDLGFKALERFAQVVYTHRRQLGALLALSTVHRNTRLRVSFSAILRVKKGQRFLLIRNVRHPEYSAPIGGVIHYFPAARDLILDQVNFEDQFETEDGPKDIRGYLTGRHFARFMQWFYSGKHVESGALQREIEEELAEIGAPLRVPALEFDLVKVVHEGPAAVKGTDYVQYRLFRIYELQRGDPGSARFEGELLKLAASHPKLFWATSGEIRRGKLPGGPFISDHAGYFFDDKRLGHEPAPIE